jgi:hypothetical protein
MVFGAIINWTVGKTLDLTFDTIWWITKKTGQGIYNAGHYLIISKNKNREFQIIEKENESEIEHKINLENTKEELAQRYEIVKLLKEQNKLLAEEIRLLQNSNQSNEQTDKKNTEEEELEEELEKEVKEKKD